MYNLSKAKDVEYFLKYLEEDCSDLSANEEEEEHCGVLSPATVRIGDTEPEPDIENTKTAEGVPDFIPTKKKKIKWIPGSCESMIFSWKKVNADNTNREISTPFSYFKKYIPDSIIDCMGEKTTMYAMQNNINMQPTNKNEIKTFLGLHIIAGTLKFPRLEMYWEKALRMNVFLENMSRDRFLQLRTAFHVVDNLND